MEIIFLGTAQAIPTEKRNHTSILIKHENENILVDCGEGTQRQFRIAKINPCKVTKLLLTHWHGDHVLGLPGLLQTLALNNYSKTLQVYCPSGTSHFFDLLMQTFVPRGKIKVKIEEIKKDGIFFSNCLELSAFRMRHAGKCVSYVIKEKDKRKMDKGKIKKFSLHGRAIGMLQQGKSIEWKGKKIEPEDVSYIKKGKKISIILDTELCENCFKAAENADLLICESTYLHELHEKAKEYKHLTAKQAAGIAKKAKAKHLVLTHISQRYQKDESKVLEEAKKIFPAELAQDFMRISI